MDALSDIIGGACVGFIIGYVVGFYANYFYEMRLEKRAIENNKIRHIKERLDCYMKYGNKDECICSECGKGNLKYSTVFCPDCGARMDGETE